MAIAVARAAVAADNAMIVDSREGTAAIASEDAEETTEAEASVAIAAAASEAGRVARSAATSLPASPSLCSLITSRLPPPTPVSVSSTASTTARTSPIAMRRKRGKSGKLSAAPSTRRSAPATSSGTACLCHRPTQGKYLSLIYFLTGTYCHQSRYLTLLAMSLTSVPPQTVSSTRSSCSCGSRLT